MAAAGGWLPTNAPELLSNIGLTAAVLREPVGLGLVLVAIVEPDLE
jgi:hypothetical protein